MNCQGQHPAQDGVLQDLDLVIDDQGDVTLVRLVRGFAVGDTIGTRANSSTWRQSSVGTTCGRGGIDRPSWKALISHLTMAAVLL